MIDIATVIAAPYCATVLGEFGADVLKVEHPDRRRRLRRFGTPSQRGDTLTWLSEARNKRSMTIDLRTPAGVEVFKQLIAKTDVLCENFRTGTLEKWGLGWDVLKAINPGLVMLRVTGYGQTGPYKDRPGFARVAHAVGGIAYLAGMPKGTPVTPGSTTLGDYMTRPVRLPGRADGAAPQGAHRRRAVHRRGAVRIGIPLHRRAGAGLWPVRHRARAAPVRRTTTLRCRTATLPPRTANGWPSPAPPTCCSRGWPRPWAARNWPRPAPTANRRPVWTTATMSTRSCATGAASLSREEVLARCYATDTPAGPLNNIADIFGDRQFHARRNLVAMDAPDTGEQIIVPAPVPRLSETPGSIRSLGPKLGEHTDEILRELLGFSDAQIAELRAKKAI